MKKKIKFLLLFFIMIFFFSFFYTGIILPKNIKDIKKIEIYDYEDKLIETYFNGNKIDWVILDNTSNILKDVILLVEDKDFYTHHGFEIPRIIKAFWNNLTNKKIVEGASTITQQLAKNLFFNEKRTFIRKTKELFTSIKLENKYSKKDIFECYINIIYFGNGIYGLKNASNFYFSKNPDELNLIESIILVNLIKSPSKYNPLSNSSDANDKKDQISLYLLNNNYIDNNQYNDLLNTDINDVLNITYQRKENNHYLDYIKGKINNNFTTNKKQSYNLKIYTNLNLELQNNIISLINSSNALAKSSIVCIEPYTYKVLAIQGGDDSYNRAINSKRQIGSTVKPFLYYLALENGITAEDTFNSSYLSFKYNDSNYQIHNYKNIYQGKINMAVALSTSDNVYAVKTHLYLGMNNLQNLLNRLKFSNNIKDPLLALGISETSLFRLVNSYNIFASEGTKKTPSFINKIINKNKIVYKYNENEKIVFFSKKSSFIITDLLKNTFDEKITYSTASNINYLLDREYSAKSGLTDYDSYFIGYNKYLTVGVWTGYDDNLILETREDLTNSKYIWANIMNYYQFDKPKDWYKEPKGLKKEIINFSENYQKHVYFVDNLLYYQ